MKLTLKAARVNAGLNQSQAAERLGISKDMVSNFERGLTYPKVPIIKKMEELYGVGFNDLIFLPENNN